MRSRRIAGSRALRAARRAVATAAPRPTVATAALAILLAVPFGACRRGPADTRERVVEREETIGGAPVRLRSNLSPPRGTLGDRVSWRLDATLGEGLVPGPLLLDPAPSALDLDASNAPSLVRERSGLRWSRSFLVRAFDLGAVALPAARIPVGSGTRRDTLEFPQDTVFVDSLTESITGTLRPDSGPIEPGLRAVDYAVLILGALLLAGAAAFLISMLLRSRRKAEAPAAAEVEPPEARLTEALEALEAEFPTLTRDVFYERLSLALRSYAAAVTGVPALDLTTAELTRELAHRGRVREAGRRALIAALDRADLAKFARYEDESAEAKAMLCEARSIAGALVEALPARAPGAGAGPSAAPGGGAPPAAPGPAPGARI
ncbi:MAG: hypothetical protein HY568_05115 [Candidatus Latescibacteria bacterium]|nr:hypothetical protein [Candidatus Latescibacterota bacterium]